MIPCCSCLVTPNGLVNVGVNRDLAVKTLTLIPTSVVVKLLATLAGGNGTGSTCPNTAALTEILVNDGLKSPVASGMVAWRMTTDLAPLARMQLPRRRSRPPR